jgi:hypothetical protein
MPADNVGFERQAKQIRNKKRADRHRGYKKNLLTVATTSTEIENGLANRGMECWQTSNMET